MPISSFLITIVIFSVVSFPSCFSADQQDEECRLPLRCGSGPSVFPNITYPFWGNNIGKPNFCGQTAFELSCKENQNLTIEIENFNFRVVSADLEDHTITVADESLFEGGCPMILNFKGDDRFSLNPTTETIDLFTCSYPVQSLSTITCEGSKRTYHVFRLSNFSHGCEKAGEIPMLSSAKKTLYGSNDTNQALKMALEKGIGLRYTIQDKICRDCTISSGICGSESDSGNFRCLCQDKPHNSSCQDDQVHFLDSGLSTKARTGIGYASGLVVIILIACGVFCIIRWRRNTSNDPRQQKLKALIPLKHYSYTQVKRITNSFAEIIGKGGFGTVYKGTLGDGRSVAVKVLKDSKGNGEDFINEVASMSKTSHVNIVSLVGFCSQGSKRAIIYEFLENGSLDQLISSNTSMNMDWMALYGIALGVARGLEYLHYGCKTRIVHFDIKPHNVLLDEDLCPKVSDFGLAKLCEKNESILSLLDTRGTIGYIAPEVFSRMYGRVSHKSDVYSYGMLVLEMIGARNKERAAQNSSSNTSSMYFPEWIYKDLEKGNKERLIEIGIINEEEEIAKKMTLVGLWCIQSSPSDRPPMNKVVEMMEGSVDALQVPPRPVFQIPAASLRKSSTLGDDISEVCSMNVA